MGWAGAWVGVGLAAVVGLGENLVVEGAGVTLEVRSMVVAGTAVVTWKGAAALTWLG